jgi:hypothetical protein
VALNCSVPEGAAVAEVGEIESKNTATEVEAVAAVLATVTAIV